MKRLEDLFGHGAFGQHGPPALAAFAAGHAEVERMQRDLAQLVVAKSHADAIAVCHWNDCVTAPRVSLPVRWSYICAGVESGSRPRRW